MRALRFIFVILCATPLFAQTVQLHGKISDSSGGVIPGARVSISSSQDSRSASTVTSGDGSFVIELPRGPNMLEISAQGFETYRQPVNALPNAPAMLVTLALANITQEAAVEDNPSLIKLEPENNQTALVLNEEDVQSLPDDEDEMIAYLTELAGPRAAAAGGVQFIVDGFQTGRLPPKDQIKEIRINTNPFTTEYSKAGFGRIEIITRPGTGKKHGNFNFNLRNDALNARNAFAPVKLPYSRENYQAAMSGPFIRNQLSLTLLAQLQDRSDADTIHAITAGGPLNSSIYKPSLRRIYDARGQYALTPNNSLSFNAEFGSNHHSNQGAGGFTLAERASTSNTRQLGLQFRDTAVLSVRFINEARFEFNNSRSATNPLTLAPAINVLDAFLAGGAPNRNEETDRRFLFGDSLIFNKKRFTLKTGVQADYYRNSSYSANNFLGTFVFSSLDAYRAGSAATFTIDGGNPLLTMSQVELGAFAQTDIRLSKRLLVSPGIRYQTQSNISDRNDFDPRVVVAYELNRETILRTGAGIFHQNLQSNLVQQLMRLDGTRQQQIVIRNPAFPDPLGGGIAKIIPVSLRVRSENLATPYTADISMSLERSWKRGPSMSVSYDFIRGIHLYRSRNSNAPLPGTLVRPDPSRGNVLQLESTGMSTYHGLTLGWREHLMTFLDVFTSYTISTTFRDTDGAFSLPADNYDLRSEWGRASDDQRHHFSIGINGRLPWNISVTTITRANSGRPYNITTGYDDNGDTIVNDRPAGVGRNTGLGPGLFDTNFNLSRTIAFGPKEAIELGPQDANESGSGKKVRLRSGLGSSAKHPNRAPKGGTFGHKDKHAETSSEGQPRRHTATIFMNFQNVLNHSNLGNYSGVMTSPFFGRANSARNPRQIETGIRFNF